MGETTPVFWPHGSQQMNHERQKEIKKKTQKSVGEPNDQIKLEGMSQLTKFSETWAPCVNVVQILKANH